MALCHARILIRLAVPTTNWGKHLRTGASVIVLARAFSFALDRGQVAFGNALVGVGFVVVATDGGTLFSAGAVSSQRLLSQRLRITRAFTLAMDLG